MKLLTRAEEFCLLSVQRHDGDAYGASIRNHLIDSTDSDWSIGVVYQTLDRLAAKGLLTSYIGEPTAERGGRSKKFFQLTKAGKYQLAQIRDIQRSMWAELKQAGRDLPSLSELG
jgi:PadR family transcriptional regulator PadR